jgi:hypothetical protein
MKSAEPFAMRLPAQEQLLILHISPKRIHSEAKRPDIRGLIKEDDVFDSTIAASQKCVFSKSSNQPFGPASSVIFAI